MEVRTMRFGWNDGAIHRYSAGMREDKELDEMTLNLTDPFTGNKK